MICSLRTGKSGSNWLDRLRSSKGFPAHNDLDLDQFLSNSNPPDPNIAPESEKPVPDRRQTTSEVHQEGGEREWLCLMSNVLSELFNMGGEKPADSTRGKKSSRKQLNPRVYAVSTSSPSNGETVPSSGENSCADVKERSEKLRAAREGNVDVEDEDEDYYGDLSGFSRTEVTVIDSSCASWKSEKLLFRRKSVWRVREKKGRSVRVAKKRKGRPLEDESGGGEKKRKLSKDGVDEESRMVMPSSNVLVQSDKTNEGRTDRPNVVRFPRKSKKCGSSAVLAKSVPTNKKNAANIRAVSCLMETQTNYKA